NKVAFGDHSSKILRGETGFRPLNHQINARTHARPVRCGERDLLTYDRRQVAVKSQQELFDITPSGVRIYQRETRCELRPKYDRGHKAKHCVNRAVVNEAEAPDLISRSPAVRRIEEVDFWIAKHPNLRVDVSQVRNLDDLGDAFEACISSGPKEALRRI